jgi:predicted ATP-binding protein involved in virulence
MIVTRLKIANLRAIEVAEFRFQPGFNLIVGVNGVGKTSVLDALKVCLSAIVKHTNRLRAPVISFVASDIRVGTEALTLECDFLLGGREYSYIVHKPREMSMPQKKNVGIIREQVHNTPKHASFLGESPSPVSSEEPSGRPLAVLFSTSRAVPSERMPSQNVVKGGIAAASADALASRELRLGEFAAWMAVKETMRKEHPDDERILIACEDAVRRFLPGYENLRLGGEDGKELWINHGNTAVPVRQLSDGERGTLALVLDLTRRLAQANPHLKDPAAESEAVVLIDEIDLHLHPKWQRQIVNNLRSAFPRCQFIATTHSPQIIGEVKREQIQIISEGNVYSPTHSFGVDSSRVLEEIMNSDPRTFEVMELIQKISQAIGMEQFDLARDQLVELNKKLGDNDPEVTRLRTILAFLEGEA